MRWNGTKGETRTKRTQQGRGLQIRDTSRQWYASDKKQGGNRKRTNHKRRQQTQMFRRRVRQTDRQVKAIQVRWGGGGVKEGGGWGKKDEHGRGCCSQRGRYVRSKSGAVRPSFSLSLSPASSDLFVFLPFNSQPSLLLLVLRFSHSSQSNCLTGHSILKEFKGLSPWILIFMKTT